MSAIHPTKVNHLNIVVENFEAAIRHFAAAYDAELMIDMPQQDLHAGLFEIGRVIFEPFVPHAWFLNARYGPHYVGVEYQTDVELARSVVGARGIRIIRDVGVAFHTHPDDCFGIAFEFYDGEFHGREWPLLGGPIKPECYWRDAHPLGITGLYGYSVAVADINVAARFYEELFDAEPAGIVERLDLAAEARIYHLAGSIVELLSPTGPGVIRSHIDRYGDGIRATIFGVESLDAACRHLAARGVASVPGDAPGRIAVLPERNLGIMFEFSE